jgi:alpha-N-arabinofuranosidase
VVNRHPEKAISSSIELPGFTPSGRATVFEVNSGCVHDENTFGNEKVSLTQKEIPRGKSLTYSFPAHSITLLKLYQ